MIDFLKYIVRVKKDYSYNNLSLSHVALLLIFFLGAFLIIRLIKLDKNNIKIKKIDTLLTILLIVIQIIYYSWYIITQGEYDPYPLYICRISAILLCITPFLNWRVLEDFAIFSGIYGSLCAVILSTPSPFASPHIMVFSYFVLHFSLGYLALTRLILRKSKINFKVFWNTCIINTLFLCGIFILDKIFTWNYSFLIYPPLFYNIYLKMNTALYTLGAFLSYFLLLFIGYKISKIIKNKVS